MTTRACMHCGLPVPANAVDPNFCCVGCATVHRLLRDEGLETFYDLGGADGRPVGAAPTPQARDWLPELLAAAVDVETGVGRATLDLQGIRCAACVWLLQELWSRRDGAVDMRLNPSLGRVDLVWSAAALDLSEWLDEIERLGYRAAPVGERAGGADRGLLARLGVCAALAMNAMMFAFAEYLGMNEGADGGNWWLFQWLSFGLATLAVVIGGPVFFRAALTGLRRAVLHLDLPISLGILLAWGSSVVAFARAAAGGAGAGGDSYFDTVTVFIALMLAGRWVQDRAVARNQAWLLANDGVEHLRAKRLTADGVERVPVRSIAVGDRLLLAPGDLVPARGRLAKATDFSLDWIEGESEPRPFAAGATVPAGAFAAGRRPVVLDVEASPADSGLLAMLQSPPAAAAGTGSGEAGGGRHARFWARVNQLWVIGVLVLATAGGLLWAALDPSRIASVVTAVLVVTCPCALGLAIPLAFDLALARLRERGVFVRSAELLDKARHVRTVLFDKTGTLTWGGLRADVLREPQDGLARDVLWTMTSSSNHPVSRAIADAVAAGANWIDELDVEETPGNGVTARHAGSTWCVGRRAFTLGDRDGAPDDGVVLLTRDGHVEFCARVEEDFRAGAADELAAIARSGRDVWLVSGDRQAKVDRARDLLGLDAERVRAELRPDDKARLVASLDDHDTLMVGDGLNDGPAFDAAYCAGTPAVDRPVMPSRADFFYTGLGVGAVLDMFETATRFRSVVVVNLVLALVYNVGAVALAWAGWMSPLLCAIVMPISSIALLVHTAMRLRAPGRDRPRSVSAESAARNVRDSAA